MAKRQKKGAAGKQSKKDINTTPLYIIFVVAIVAYILLQSNSVLSTISGFAVFFILVALIVLESANSIRDKGIKSSAIEIGAVIAVVLIGWLVVSFLLHTSSPFNVVPSCSMLPNLHRGDLIIVQGVNNVSQIKAPMLRVTSAQWQQTISNLTRTTTSCVAYSPTSSGSNIDSYYRPGDLLGLYTGNSSSGSLQSPNYPQSGLIQYSCGTENIEFTNGTRAQVAYTSGITINGKTASQNINNTIVVYKTVPQDLFYREGDSLIVHRALAVVNASGSYYVLTMGDNNQGLDIQFYNQPPAMSNIVGKVVAVIPYLGYVKLAFSGQVSTPAGCNYVTVH